MRVGAARSATRNADNMKGTRHSPEQIATKLHPAATKLAGGKQIEAVGKSLAISPATYPRWQEHHGGAEVNTVKELKAMKEANAKRRKLVADLALDKVALKGLLTGKWQTRRASERELSQRRTCKRVGQPRATQRHVPKPDVEETRLRKRLTEFSRQQPRAGHRPVGVNFVRKGCG